MKSLLFLIFLLLAKTASAQAPGVKIIEQSFAEKRLLDQKTILEQFKQPILLITFHTAIPARNIKSLTHP
jgi:hypothetical protein